MQLKPGLIYLYDRNMLMRKKILLPILPCLFFSGALSAQIKQEGTRVPIANTGCTVQVICFPGRFDAYELEDGSTVYADDCQKDGTTYGIYCVKQKIAAASLPAAEDSIKSYLEFLKLDYGIVKSKGYNTDHKLHGDDNTRGVFDTWEDADGNKWKVRGWTNKDFVCILYVFNSKEIPEKKAELFLNGLLFPGMKEKKKEKD